ncbi:amino acid kinase family protein [Archaeoglobus veneficus]|uniref:Aspartate/glutamate/uridylate kinase n=1 Tax=Archaeoglobus veneficus (strain DSM 11195 / SNP6) TaxID=693661 RepID=F2KRU3_ARCVS|nr:uridylate kinase [Archaeoglobus veneficus]AEA47957.1 aspartate/glutamate/uridylate kinase [Archaeoglobus veneficus SNP6]
MRVAKLGGSVASRLSGILDELKAGGDVLIVPGGWIFADSVRELDEQRRLPPSAAHWMCIAGMEMYAHYISSFGVNAVEDLKEEEIKGLCVLLPYKTLRLADELPHSWDVTSDSIAVWVASKLGVEEVIKITNVDGVYVDGEFVERVEASALIGKKTCVDSFAPKLMVETGIDMFVCNGLVEGRVKNYILGGRAKGTLIEGK